MIEMEPLAVPVPYRVSAMASSRIPKDVLQARVEARVALFNLVRCPFGAYCAEREDALTDLAAANKVIAAFDPFLMVRFGS
ncbi:hypothetical protein [Streptomyces sp. NPDC059009]|uniref:hypothetical protein n=1 Tax=Streptomyces sp. NPDC059009 TaxID=3346694 RepID=UPI00368A17C7